MTRATKRLINSTNSCRRCGKATDPVLWQALCAIHNLCFHNVVRHYHMSGCPDDHIIEAFRILDCWLDIAVEEGWMTVNDKH